MSGLKTWLGRLGKGVDKSNYLSGQVMLWGFIVIAFLWTTDALIRSLGMSIGTWVTGAGRYITVISPYLTAGYAMYALGHVRVTIAIQWLDERARAWIELMAYSWFLVFALTFTWFFIKWAQFVYIGQDFLVEIEWIKMWWVYAVCIIGLVLFALQITRHMVGIAQRIASGQLAKGTRFYSQPYFIVPLFLALIGLSYWVMSVSVIAGFFTVLLVMMFMSIPIPAALGSIAVFGLFTYGGYLYLRPLAFMGFYYLSDPSWLTLPMFMLGGVMFGTAMAQPLFRTIKAWVGWIPGGMAVATIWIACVMGAIIGSMFAALTVLSYFCLPELDRDGFPREFTLPMICAAIVISILIPPSITLVIFGVITETSVGGCLFAGIGPGLLMTVLFSLYVIIWAVRKGKVPRILTSWKERFASIPPSIVPLLAPVILIGGILTGLLTPNEAACGMAVYILIASLAMRKIKGVRQINAFGPDLNRTLGYIMLTLVCVGPISRCLSYYQVPQDIAAWAVAAGLSRWAMFAFLMVLMTAMGCVGEAFVLMIVLLPILMPTIEAMGIHPFWLAIFFCVQVPLAGLTPPVGGMVFFCANLNRVEPYFIFKGILPWLCMDLLVLLIVFIFPPIATWLPLAVGFTP